MDRVFAHREGRRDQICERRGIGSLRGHWREVVRLKIRLVGLGIGGYESLIAGLVVARVVRFLGSLPQPTAVTLLAEVSTLASSLAWPLVGPRQRGDVRVSI